MVLYNDSHPISCTAVGRSREPANAPQSANQSASGVDKTPVHLPHLLLSMSAYSVHHVTALVTLYLKRRRSS